MKIYLAQYCSCIHESASATISVHRTPDGAQKAVEFHKEEKRKEWVELFDAEQQNRFPFGDGERWGVKEIELQD